jgi:hypothetical protein
MPNRKISRRGILRSAFVSAVTLSGVAARTNATDNRLSKDDPKAKKLGYVEDASQVDPKRFLTYKTGQACANCTLVQQRYGFWRPCQLFPGKLTNAKGWCSGWTNKSPAVG